MSTARIATEAQRKAFVAGIRAVNSGRWTNAKAEAAENLAVRAFPMPTYERPRIVKVKNMEFKVEGGELWSRVLLIDAPRHIQSAAARWRRSPQTPESLAELIELFQRPTETVEIA